MKLVATFLLLSTWATFADGETCKNKQDDQYCSAWKDLGYCAKDSEYRTFMEDSCKKSCSLCVEEQKDCLNSAQHSANCPLWKQVNYCSPDSQHFGFMSQHCKLECGLCTVTKLAGGTTCSDSGKYEQCPLWKSHDFCKETNKYHGFMKDHCNKTCGFCKDECKDLGTAAYCEKYKTYCKNEVVGNTISYNCKKTCGVCKETSVCGKGFDPSGRVVGGVDATPGSWPWQAALKVSGAFTCGGTLVAKKWVLTAGHCLTKSGTLVKEGDLEVILGDFDRSKVDGTEQVLKVLRIVRHPSYNPQTKDTDIALLELNEEAILNNFVGLACLPTEEPKTNLDGTCYITGFGKTGDEDPPANILQQARLPVVTNSICSILNKYPTITSNMLCAGYGLDFSHTESGCRGDSGGPFVCEKNGVWSVQGVVSWGSSRCISGENYTVFARVLKFVEWIKATIG